MAWKQTANNKSGGGDYESPPTGNQVGALTGLFDVGTHLNPYKGEMKERRVIIPVFQLAKTNKAGKNFLVADRFTWSLNKKSKFRTEIIEKMIGRVLAEGEEFDPRALLGMQCLVSIVSTTNGDKTYTNLGGVSQLPDFAPPPDFKSTYRYPIVAWSVDDDEPFPREHDEWLPYTYGESIVDQAESCKEVRQRSYRPGPAEPVPPSRELAPAHAMIPAVGDDDPPY